MWGLLEHETLLTVSNYIPLPTLLLAWCALSASLGEKLRGGFSSPLLTTEHYVVYTTALQLRV